MWICGLIRAYKAANDIPQTLNNHNHHRVVHTGNNVPVDLVSVYYLRFCTMEPTEVICALRVADVDKYRLPCVRLLRGTNGSQSPP